MVSASDYVDGATVDGRRLAVTLFGGVVLGYWYGFWEFFETVAGLFGKFPTALINAYTEIMSAGLDVPAELMRTAWFSAAGWLQSVGVILGPFAYPLAMLVTIAVAHIAYQTALRVRVI
jgi:hypothetical protein